MAVTKNSRLIDRLPELRGSYRADVSMAGVSWFKVGGPAEVVFRPADELDLIAFLQQRPMDVDVTLIGAGSNLLVRDGGISGVVIRMGREMGGVRIEGDDVFAEGMAMDVNIARAAADAGLTGLEFLRGIPGSIGAALGTNAGAYGREIKDVLIAIRAVDKAGNVHEVAAADIKLGYRHSEIPEDWIVTEVHLSAEEGEIAEIAARMAAITDAREETQPVRARTGGSTFKNPQGHKAWELIDAAGCRGLMRGGAQVSEQHCNFLINLGDATARDLEELGEEVRRRVKANSGIELEWEIKRIGEFDDQGIGAVQE
jgi:UDP-N-acetylmuramate dehydrogenase